MRCHRRQVRTFYARANECRAERICEFVDADLCEQLVGVDAAEQTEHVRQHEPVSGVERLDQCVQLCRLAAVVRLLALNV